MASAVVFYAMDAINRDSTPPPAPARGVGAMALWLGMVMGLAALGWVDRVRAREPLPDASRSIPALLVAIPLEGGDHPAPRQGPSGAGSWDGSWDGSPVPYPRLLRQAAGLGRRRAMLVARALWEHGPDLELESLEGVGPKTAQSIRRVLFPEEHVPRPYTPGARLPPQPFDSARPGPKRGLTPP